MKPKTLFVLPLLLLLVTPAFSDPVELISGGSDQGQAELPSRRDV